MSFDFGAGGVFHAGQVQAPRHGPETPEAVEMQLLKQRLAAVENALEEAQAGVAKRDAAITRGRAAWHEATQQLSANRQELVLLRRKVALSVLGRWAARATVHAQVTALRAWKRAVSAPAASSAPDARTDGRVLALQEQLVASTAALSDSQRALAIAEEGVAKRDGAITRGRAALAEYREQLAAAQAQLAAAQSAPAQSAFGWGYAQPADTIVADGTLAKALNEQRAELEAAALLQVEALRASLTASQQQAQEELASHEAALLELRLRGEVMLEAASLAHAAALAHVTETADAAQSELLSATRGGQSARESGAAALESASEHTAAFARAAEAAEARVAALEGVMYSLRTELAAEVESRQEEVAAASALSSAAAAVMEHLQHQGDDERAAHEASLQSLRASIAAEVDAVHAVHMARASEAADATRSGLLAHVAALEGEVLSFRAQVSGQQEGSSAASAALLHLQERGAVLELEVLAARADTAAVQRGILDNESAAAEELADVQSRLAAAYASLDSESSVGHGMTELTGLRQSLSDTEAALRAAESARTAAEAEVLRLTDVCTGAEADTARLLVQLGSAETARADAEAAASAASEQLLLLSSSLSQRVAVLAAETWDDETQELKQRLVVAGVEAEIHVAQVARLQKQCEDLQLAVDAASSALSGGTTPSRPLTGQAHGTSDAGALSADTTEDDEVVTTPGGTMRDPSDSLASKAAHMSPTALLIQAQEASSLRSALDHVTMELEHERMVGAQLAEAHEEATAQLVEYAAEWEKMGDRLAIEEAFAEKEAEVEGLKEELLASRAETAALGAQVVTLQQSIAALDADWQEAASNTELAVRNAVALKEAAEDVAAATVERLREAHSAAARAGHTAEAARMAAMEAEIWARREVEAAGAAAAAATSTAAAAMADVGEQRALASAAEAGRLLAEARRSQAEEGRSQADAIRVQAQLACSQAEEAKRVAEASLAQAEAGRMQAEAQRATEATGGLLASPPSTQSSTPRSPSGLGRFPVSTALLDTFSQRSVDAANSTRAALCAQARLAASDVPATISLCLLLDYESLGAEGSEQSEQFAAAVAADLASALEVDASRVQVQSFASGSPSAQSGRSAIVVQVLLLPTEDGGEAPLELVARLAVQLSSPSSPLHEGTATRHVDTAVALEVDYTSPAAAAWVALQRAEADVTSLQAALQRMEEEASELRAAATAEDVSGRLADAQAAAVRAEEERDSVLGELETARALADQLPQALAAEHEAAERASEVERKAAAAIARASAGVEALQQELEDARYTVDRLQRAAAGQAGAQTTDGAWSSATSCASPEEAALRLSAAASALAEAEDELARLREEEGIVAEVAAAHLEAADEAHAAAQAALQRASVVEAEATKLKAIARFARLECDALRAANTTLSSELPGLRAEFRALDDSNSVLRETNEELRGALEQAHEALAAASRGGAPLSSALVDSLVSERDELARTGKEARAQLALARGMIAALETQAVDHAGGGAAAVPDPVWTIERSQEEARPRQSMLDMGSALAASPAARASIGQLQSQLRRALAERDAVRSELSALVQAAVSAAILAPAWREEGEGGSGQGGASDRARVVQLEAALEASLRSASPVPAPASIVPSAGLPSNTPPRNSKGAAPRAALPDARSMASLLTSKGGRGRGR
jgi:hypothetical protein